MMMIRRYAFAELQTTHREQLHLLKFSLVEGGNRGARRVLRSSVDCHRLKCREIAALHEHRTTLFALFFQMPLVRSLLDQQDSYAALKWREVNFVAHLAQPFAPSWRVRTEIRCSLNLQQLSLRI
jgi:hypothetical protein